MPTTTTTYSDDIVCVPRAGNLYDVLDLILDRGMVIDVFLRVSLVGIEILKIDARIVVASVDTYLRFAEACNRLDLEADRSRTVPELFGGAGGAAGAGGRSVAKKTAKTLGGAVRRAVTGGGEEEEAEEHEEPEGEAERPERRPPREARPRKRASAPPRGTRPERGEP
ncbi:MAG TPA: gas vesicle protein GvpJ [Streptomyces sp.]|uniref:gas vesicle protein GvpJ n=1 Tax=Streptomyces sp. TaxID=1931 RepID=UPI002D5AA0A4|nr:gas vesicle protein GvpJ [Streptomyces sp.]HZG05341.1 gas vesicle protein GvpJ [Streptomyces sp.]